MAKRTVHIVDDDPAVLQSLFFMLRTEEIECTSHSSAEDLLQALDGLADGPILLDLRLGGMSGQELQRELHRRDCHMPVVIITGHGDVASAVATMKEGAIDFLQKPFSKSELMDALEAAEGAMEQDLHEPAAKAEACQMVEQLSPRERQVLEGLAHGKANKTIAFDLGISPRTIEIHRANAMKKLNVRTLPDMLHLAFLAGVMDG